MSLSRAAQSASRKRRRRAACRSRICARWATTPHHSRALGRYDFAAKKLRACGAGNASASCSAGDGVCVSAVNSSKLPLEAFVLREHPGPDVGRSQPCDDMGVLVSRGNVDWSETGAVASPRISAIAQ